MARKINFQKPLSEDERLYVEQRPWLIRDAELAGLTVRYAGDSDAPEDDEPDDEDVDDEETEDNDDEDSEEDSDDEDEESYESLTVAELKELIETRNEERDEDDQIEPAGTKKADLIAALEADDAE